MQQDIVVKHLFDHKTEEIPPFAIARAQRDRGNLKEAVWIATTSLRTGLAMTSKLCHFSAFPLVKVGKLW